MSIRKLRYYGDPILRRKAKKMHRFDASLPKIVQDMFETFCREERTPLSD